MRKRIKKGLIYALTHGIIQSSKGKAQGQPAAGGPDGRSTLKTEIVWPATLETGPGK